MLVMLRNRSRRATSKQALMRAENDSQSPPPTPAAQSHTKPMTSFLVSPRFKAFTFQGLPAEAEPVMSPTSILDHSKHFSPFKNPIWCEEAPLKSPRGFPAENKPSWEKLDSKGIGVALIDDTASDETSEENSSTSISKSSNRVVLSGAKLRVQIPPLPNCTLSPVGSPILNPQLSTGSSKSSNQMNDSPQIFAGFLSISEMELSEDYTCVISHGPNPTTTHIFGNCIVDKCCLVSDKSNSSRKDFLSFCHTCKKKLGQKNDIYIYRFCPTCPCFLVHYQDSLHRRNLGRESLCCPNCCHLTWNAGVKKHSAVASAVAKKCCWTESRIKNLAVIKILNSVLSRGSEH